MDDFYGFYEFNDLNDFNESTNGQVLTMGCEQWKKNL
jgi:hypothetical protein